MSAGGATRAQVLADPAGWVASVAGAGLSPWAPGTVGSLVALLPWWGMVGVQWWLPWLVIPVVFALGVWASSAVIRRLGVEDPGVIVIDEVVGQWLALSLVDLALRVAPWPLLVPSTLALLLAGFLVFRLCDILKPWPASWADRKLDGGFGAMVDDALAGVWAGVLVVVTLSVIPALR
jgi:phosphatidylglycerophosphatase A